MTQKSSENTESTEMSESVFNHPTLREKGELLAKMWREYNFNAAQRALQTLYGSMSSAAIARKIFPVEELPQGALPRYNQRPTSGMISWEDIA